MTTSTSKATTESSSLLHPSKGTGMPSSNSHDNSKLYYTLGTGKLQSSLGLTPEVFALSVQGRNRNAASKSTWIDTKITEKIKSICHKYSGVSNSEHKKLRGEIQSELEAYEDTDEGKGYSTGYVSNESYRSLHKLTDIQDLLGKEYPNGFLVLSTKDDDITAPFWNRLTGTSYTYNKPGSNTNVKVDGIRTFVNRLELTPGGLIGDAADRARERNFDERQKIMQDIGHDIADELMLPDGTLMYDDGNSMIKDLLRKYQEKGVGVITVHSNAMEELDCFDEIGRREGHSGSEGMVSSKE